MEQADRNRRATEIELSDINEQLSDATVQNQAIAAAKRKMELEMQTLHVSIFELAYFKWHIVTTIKKKTR